MVRSYSSAEMQSVYSTAPADWAVFILLRSKKFITLLSVLLNRKRFASLDEYVGFKGF